MKTIEKFQCDLCGDIYDTKEEALDCERQGKVDKKLYPVGLMFEYHHHGFVGIFSIAEVGYNENGRNKHLLTVCYWACRTPNLPGDSLGDEKCGGDLISVEHANWITYHKITKEKIDCAEYKRMVKFLKSKNIVPQYYNEKGELVVVK